ncbi:2-oxo acid dehydrogenase subunit E2 [Amycolatopsis sp. K13G38]|uniref:Dihydrolipoamide acetyltransferase component of pyruvate dehydrogenase complex n=1 Tax=Amycolatopsis acididurans TaxID=2724524 RepID=A0ABX1J3U8_9PSEU|nr:2-oxo acid dehydrogenase subunit E2 [Amycolatopsis acididurans]NKQ54304.1 2-oxo acid dehydrogenase subunit E2 [Amycolatopsis acididurans]
MPALLRMPGVAADSTDAILAGWQVAENAEFAAAEAIATVETDKANVDIEAEAAGVILKYLVAPGTTVEVGAPIALTGRPGETVANLDQALRDLGVGAAEPAGKQHDRGADGRRLFATPLVRRLAREADLDLNGIAGTGPNGRIVRRDIAERLAAGTPPDAAPAAPPPATAPMLTPPAGATDTPHSRMRRAIASRLTSSKQTAPHFYVRGSARVDALLALRTQLNEAGEVKISVNDLIVKAAARAHTLVPAMNVIWLDDAVRSFDDVDIAVAVASSRGLMTPVVRDVDRRGIAAIAADTRDLAERARHGKLNQEELEGGSLSISNLGMYDTEEFSAIINPPQSAILAVGAARSEPVVIDGELAVGSMLRVTLSVDHRPIDGAVAAEWMKAFLDVLHAPLQILM